MAHLAPVTFFAFIIVIVVAILNYRLKMQMIKSGRIDNPEIIGALTNTLAQKIDALKWGLITLFGGLGLMVISFIPEQETTGWMLHCGIEVVFLAIGFLSYYFILRKRDHLL